MNDETCCAGSNYTNNVAIISDTVSKGSVTIYDEWKEFGNEGKEEEYVPVNASFSQDGCLIAISITGDQRLSSIRKTDGSGNAINLRDRFVVGWLDPHALLLGSIAATVNPDRNEVQDIFLYDIQSGKEESLSLNGVTYIAFE